MFDIILIVNPNNPLEAQILLIFSQSIESKATAISCRQIILVMLRGVCF